MKPPRHARRRDRLPPAGAAPLAAWSRRGGPLRVLIWTVRVGTAVALAVGVGYLPYHLYLRTGLSQFVKLRGELSQLEARNQKLRGGILELRMQLERMQQDSDAIERVARDELGLVRAGEVVYKVE
jgi:cell division protein FtsB